MTSAIRALRQVESCAYAPVLAALVQEMQVRRTPGQGRLHLSQVGSPRRLGETVSRQVAALDRSLRRVHPDWAYTPSTSSADLRSRWTVILKIAKPAECSATLFFRSWRPCGGPAAAPQGPRRKRCAPLARPTGTRPRSLTIESSKPPSAFTSRGIREARPAISRTPFENIPNRYLAL